MSIEHKYFGCTRYNAWYVGKVYQRDPKKLLRLLTEMVNETHFVPPDAYKAIAEIEKYIDEIVKEFRHQVSSTLYPTDTLAAWSLRYPWLADDFDKLWQTIRTTETVTEHEPEAQSTEDTTQTTT